MKAALDSSVLVSAFLSPSGTPAALLARARDGAFSLCLSRHILAESAAALLRKSHRSRREYTVDEVAEFCVVLTLLAERIEDDLPEIRAVAADPKDDMVVATAVAGGADAQVITRGRGRCEQRRATGQSRRHLREGASRLLAARCEPRRHFRRSILCSPATTHRRFVDDAAQPRRLCPLGDGEVPGRRAVVAGRGGRPEPSVITWAYQLAGITPRPGRSAPSVIT